MCHQYRFGEAGVGATLVVALKVGGKHIAPSYMTMPVELPVHEHAVLTRH